MLRSDINIIYNDYYNDIKACDLFDNSILIARLVLEYLSKDITNIYIDTCDSFYYNILFNNLLKEIFNHFQNINIIIPINNNSNIELIKLDKNSKFICTEEGFYPSNYNKFNGEYVDIIFRFCKYFDKIGNYELINNINLTNLKSEILIGLCLFEPVYEISDFINNEKLNSYIYPEACIDIYE